jgi:hypothetical protein
MSSVFKPTLYTLLIFLFLFGSSYYFSSKLLVKSGGPSTFGFPLPFYVAQGCSSDPRDEMCWDSQFLYPGFFVNALIWYSVAWVIGLGIDKARNKLKN